MKMLQGALAFLMFMLPIALSLSRCKKEVVHTESGTVATASFTTNCPNPCKILVSFTDDDSDPAVTLTTTDPIVVADGSTVIWQAEVTELGGKKPTKKKAMLKQVHFVETTDTASNKNKRNDHPDHGKAKNDDWETVVDSNKAQKFPIDTPFSYWIKVKHQNHPDKTLDPELVVAGTEGPTTTTH